MRQLGSRVAFGVRELGWKLDERVLWPATDAIQYMPSEDGQLPEGRRSWWRRYGVDLVIAAALVVVAFLLRRHGLPTDGLWLDDAVQGAGLTASPSDLFAVSADHPGFTALLIGWRALGGGSDAALTYPTLAAGALGPALLYLALRYCGFERSIAVLLGAALAVAATDVVYSGRVKTYTVDVLIVLALALIIPRLTRIRWRWWTGLAWIAAAAVLAFWSGFGLIAVAVAGPIIVLHPTFDFRLRLVAVALQESICVVLLAVEDHSHNVAALQDQFRTTWDAFIDFNGPIQFAGDAFVHLRRVGEYFAGSSHWFAGLCIAAAVVGLAVAAWEGRQAVRARYLILLLLTAFVAGVAGKFPFGPSEGFLVSSGGRVSLWLIPVVAIGLAAALQGVRGLLPDRLPRLFDAAACVAAALILVTAASRDPVAYPFPGAQSATQFIRSQLGDRDAVLVGYRSDWSYATESGLDSGIERTPETSVGFSPSFHDTRVNRVETLADAQHLAPEVSQANRVFVYYPEHPYSAAEAQLRPQLAATMRARGFAQQPTKTFQDASVQIWNRIGAVPEQAPSTQPAQGGAISLGQLNLRVSDLPQGWKLVSSPGAPPATQLFACLGIAPAPGAARSVQSANGPGALNTIVELDQWPGAAGPRRAAKALSRPARATCVRSTLEATLKSVGFPVSVEVSRARPPAAAGSRAVAYRAIAREEPGGAPVAEGSVAFVRHGSISALIVAFRGGQQPFPPSLLSSLTKRIGSRIGAAGG